MKDKMRCSQCGATFKPARSNQTLCDKCEKQQRTARAAAKATGGGTLAARPTAASAAPVRIVGPGAAILDPAAAGVTNATPPPDTGLYGAAAIREEQRRAQQRRDEQRRAEEQRIRDEQRAREQEQRNQERQERHGVHEYPHGVKRGAKPGGPRAERPAPAPRPPKQPRPAPPRFELTDEIRAQVEARYLELAQPVEFDGIRTQIATELGAPKSIVKRAVADLRARMQLPSWWELQSYSGAETDLERIRMAYLPHLPVPDVGIHKTLADALELDPRTVYQGIRRIRAEMRLPQYNAPELHGDLTPAQQRDGQSGAPAAKSEKSDELAAAASNPVASAVSGDGVSDPAATEQA